MKKKNLFFCINNLKIKNEHLNSINWVNFINNKKYILFGTLNKQIPNENEDIR